MIVSFCFTVGLMPHLEISRKISEKVHLKCFKTCLNGNFFFYVANSAHSALRMISFKNQISYINLAVTLKKTLSGMSYLKYFFCCLYVQSKTIGRQLCLSPPCVFRGSRQSRMFQLCQIRHSQSWLGLALILGFAVICFLNEYLISTVIFIAIKLKELLNY